jgi:hypothetical protein
MIYQLLEALDRRRLHYSISRHRNDTILISVTLVGKRIEIDVFEDNHIEYSVFTGDESVLADFDQLIASLDSE